MTGTSTGSGDASPPLPDDEGRRAAVPEPRTAPGDSDAPPPTASRWRRLRDAVRRHKAVAWVGGLAGVAAVGWAGAVGTGLAERMFADDPPATCPGADCDGRNPENAACGADAFSYFPQENNPIALQIRHSPDCHAVWGRIAAGEVGDVVTTEVAGGPVREARIAFSRDVFTRMTKVDNTGFQVTVCATPTTGRERAGDWEPYCIHATQDSPWH